MRICKNCNVEMEEDYDVHINSVQRLSGVSIRKGKNRYFVLAACCPKCKEIVLYVDETRNKYGL